LTKAAKAITYYISGPMRGKPDHNYPTFHAVEKALCERGFDVILNPARNFEGDKTRTVNEYMLEDLRMVLQADVVVLLPDWETSEGARREVELAKWVGKRFELAEFDGESANQGGLEWTFRPIDNPIPNDSPRASALDEARQLITGDRNNQYGPPTQDFDRTARMATGYGFKFVDEAGTIHDLKGHDVAIFMILLKTSRLAWTPTKRDSWVDTAGYSGCGYECAMHEAQAA
jgi:Domain of unknown function (DUF6378)/Domain of unknown function (DUF4406)